MFPGDHGSHGCSQQLGLRDPGDRCHGRPQELGGGMTRVKSMGLSPRALKRTALQMRGDPALLHSVGHTDISSLSLGL